MTFVPDTSGNTPTDKPWDHYNRKVAGDPRGVETPEYQGERVFDETNGVLFQAVGANNTDWVQLTAG